MKKRTKIERGEQQYIDIELFEKYELTNNVCFEMAIRNKNIFNIILYLNDESFIDSKEVLLSLEKIYNLTQYKYFDYNLSCIEFIAYHSYAVQWHSFYHALRDVYYCDFVTGKEEWLKFYNFSPLYSKSTSFKKNPNLEEYDFFINLEKDILNGEYDEHINFDDTSSIKEQRKEYIHEKFSSIEVFENSFTLNIKNNIGFSIKNYLNDFENLPSKLFNQDYTKHSSHSISQNFSRPYLKTSFSNKFITLENINLALPEQELIEYIKLLKNQYLKDNSCLTTAYELEFRNHYIANKTIKVKKPRGKIFDLKYQNTLDSNIKFADMFYIYDSIKSGISKNVISSKLTHYHHAKKDETFINKYYAFAEKFIEHCYYKRILTGITQLNFDV